MSELTEVEIDYILHTTPCKCKCAFHKYGKTDEEIKHAAKEEVIRKQNAIKEAKKKAEDEKKGFSIFKKIDDQSIPIDPTPRFSYREGDNGGPVRYGGVRELEQEALDGVSETEEYLRQYQQCIDNFHSVGKIPLKKSRRH